MDAESLLTALLRLQLVASAAILLVLLLRPLALRWCGAGTAYWLWLVVPLAAMAALLPAREQVVTIPAASEIPSLQQFIEPDMDVRLTRENAATPSAAQSGIRDEISRSGLLIGLWLLGAGVLLIRSIVNTRRLSSGSAIGPALVGVLRPRLVLPQDFETRFNAEERALILAHEEMHRVSRHALVNALVEVARCASWFNPLAHLAAGRLRADQELACDTAVIAAHPEARRAYAEALLKAQVAGVYLPLGCVWTSGAAGRLAERIARLSEQLPGRRRRFAGAASIVGIGIAASYAAWAQQPPRVITVQQPNPESAAVVATETLASESPKAVSAPATRVSDVSRPSTSQAPQDPSPPFRFSIGESFGPKDVEREPVTPTINGGPATHDTDLARRMDVVTGGASKTSSIKFPTAEIAIAMKERLNDPEYLKQSLAQTSIRIKRDYPRLAQELGLSEKEAERLLDLLAENQVARMAEGATFPVGIVDQQERQEELRTQREFDREEKESIQALLGDKYAQFEDYQKKRQAAYWSALIAQTRRELDLAEKPLTTAQTRTLTTALEAEQQRLARELRVLPVSQADWEKIIASHVNADQLAALREQNVATDLRLVFAMDAVIDDRRTRVVNGQTVSNMPADGGTFGETVCRITRDGIPALDSFGRPLSEPEGLAAIAQNCRPLNTSPRLPAYQGVLGGAQR